MNDLCYFATDLHGNERRYRLLFQQVRDRIPGIVLLGGDLLPSWAALRGDFFADFFFPELWKLKAELGSDYPHWCVILGNDDPKVAEEALLEADAEELLHYVHMRQIEIGDYRIIGYANVPPTPFLLKDWEKYDVGVYVDPGCVHPTEGFRSVPVNIDLRYTNITMDLLELMHDTDLSKAVLLFHAPPYQSKLDRAALDGKMVDYVPLDPHVGSIAIQRFIESHQPMVTLHGHIHESSRLTGAWRQVFGRTHSFSAAYEGDILALVEFNLSSPENAQRLLL